METPQAWRERIRHEQDLIARLRIAALRFVDAQTERMWAMVAAQRAGLSVRQIGAATALSSSRVHQIISALEATEIPQWLNEKRVTESPSNTVGGVNAGTPETQIRNWLGSEVRTPPALHRLVTTVGSGGKHKREPAARRGRRNRLCRL